MPGNGLKSSKFKKLTGFETLGFMTSNNKKTENIDLNNYVRKSLNSIDWDCNDAPENFDIHSIHPYPAKCIPQIPRKLIERFHPGDTSIVLYPFCGAGTTLGATIKVGLMLMEQILQYYHSPRLERVFCMR